MKPKQRQPLFRMSRSPRDERRDRKAESLMVNAADPRDEENAIEIARFRLMKDALGQYWASRTSNR